MKQVLRIIGGLSMLVTLCPPRAAQGAFDSRLESYEDRNPILGGKSTEEFLALQERQGPSEDDCEVTVANILDPIESEGEDENGGEIMGFATQPRRTRSHRSYDNAVSNAGFEESVLSSLVDAWMNRGRT